MGLLQNDLPRDNNEMRWRRGRHPPARSQNNNPIQSLSKTTLAQTVLHGTDFTNADEGFHPVDPPPSRLPASSLHPPLTGRVSIPLLWLLLRDGRGDPGLGHVVDLIHPPMLPRPRPAETNNWLSTNRHGAKPTCCLVPDSYFRFGLVSDSCLLGSLVFSTWICLLPTVSVFVVPRRHGWTTHQPEDALDGGFGQDLPCQLEV